MVWLRKLLFPFSVLYGAATGIRNLLYDNGIFKSATFDIPIIAVGNLSVGGTGKSPQVEYLIRLLSSKYKVATLSRGYKRKSKGFVLAGLDSDMHSLGDEPFQFHSKFPEISVAVDADRRSGIQKLAELVMPDVILLDDAFQHRKVKAGFYILLTAYGDIFSDDFLLPAGNLRESRSGAARANVIIVTKCPASISAAEMDKIRKKIPPKSGQEVYFTRIGYETQALSETGSVPVADLKQQPKVLLAGIAKPKPFFDYLKSEGDIVLEYPDHHEFTDAEIKQIKQKADSRKIITTEKDYTRLKGKLPSADVYYLPIRTEFISNGDEFDKTILNYVGKSTTNS